MGLTVEQALQQGISAHNEGKLQDAERFYQTVLQRQPLHPEANHNLGVLAGLVNKFDVALPLFKTALDANPEIEQFWLSYIDALIQEKEIDNAAHFIGQAKIQGFSLEQLYALEAQLASIDVSQNLDSSTPSEQQLSSLLDDYHNERYGDAERSARFLSIQFPHHNFSWKILAALLKKTDRIAEAVLAGQKTVEIAPYDVEGHFNLGNTLKDLGRLAEAELSYLQAIALKPDFAEAHNNLGIALKEMDRLDEAEACYMQAIALKYDFDQAHNNLGVILKDLGRLDKAEASLLQAIALNPDLTDAHSNLGDILLKKGRHQEGLYEIYLGDGCISFDLKNGLAII